MSAASRKTLIFSLPREWNSSFFLKENKFPAIWKEFKLSVTEDRIPSWADSFISRLKEKAEQLYSPIFFPQVEFWRKKTVEVVSQTLPEIGGSRKQKFIDFTVYGTLCAKFFQASRFARGIFLHAHDQLFFRDLSSSLKISINGKTELEYRWESEGAKPKLIYSTGKNSSVEISLPAAHALQKEGKSAPITFRHGELEIAGRKKIPFLIDFRGKGTITFQNGGEKKEYNNQLLAHKEIICLLEPNGIMVTIRDLPCERSFLLRTEDLLKESLTSYHAKKKSSYNQRLIRSIGSKRNKISKKNKFIDPKEQLLSFLELISFIFPDDFRKNYENPIYKLELALLYYGLALTLGREVAYRRAKEDFSNLLEKDVTIVEDWIENDWSGGILRRTMTAFAASNPQKCLDFLRLKSGNQTIWKQICRQGSPLSSLLFIGSKFTQKDLRDLVKDIHRFPLHDYWISFPQLIGDFLPKLIAKGIENFLSRPNLLAQDRINISEREGLIAFKHILRAFVAEYGSGAITILPSLGMGLCFSFLFTLRLGVQLLFILLKAIISSCISMLSSLFYLPIYSFSSLLSSIKHLINLLSHCFYCEEIEYPSLEGGFII